MIPYSPNERYQFIESAFHAENNLLSISELCELASVSRSGFYYWRENKDKISQREARDMADFKLILQAYSYRGYKKGARSIQMRLLRLKPAVKMNLKKIRRLMIKYGLQCPIRKVNPYRKMLKNAYENRTFKNILDRKFENYGPRKVLLTDITYIPYINNHEKVFAYLVTIIDACTKEVLAYEVSENLKEDFVLNTVKKLVSKHGVALSTQTLVHSDQGSHYTSIQFSNLLRKEKLRQSMSRRGNCWDNAPQESFFGHMKDEIEDKIAKCHNIIEVIEVIDKWIDYYNNERYQWKLAKLSPTEYYQFITTGDYPLKGIEKIPEIPKWEEMPNQKE